MKNILSSLVLLFSLNAAFTESQVTITLILDTAGVTHARKINVLLTSNKDQSKSSGFAFNKFSPLGYYPNKNLFQYSADVASGIYMLNVTLSTTTDKTVVDTLAIEDRIARIEIVIFLSTSSSTGDFVRKIKMISYLKNSDFIKFSSIEKPAIGAKAVFSILNQGDSTLYGYPNKGFFFGSLYREIGDDSWQLYYPLYVDIKFCDTTAVLSPLKKNKTINAWTPDDINCSEYVFKEKGNYFFELLYTLQLPQQKTIALCSTVVEKVIVYRQIFEFKVV